MTLVPVTTVRRHKVTPRIADLWAQCPLKAITPDDRAWSVALAHGNAVHTLLKLDGLRQIRVQEMLDPAEMVLRGTPQGPLRESEDYLKLAVNAVAGMRHFLEQQELELLCVEEFVNSSDRPLSGIEDVVLVLSGRVDAVCRQRATGTLVLLDAKTGTRLPSALELKERQSSFIYHYLGRCLRVQKPAIAAVTTDVIEIAQVLPHTGEWTTVCLGPDELKAGRAFVREMVLSMDRGLHPAVLGEWCAYCSLGQSGQCPEMQALQAHSEEW